MDEVVRRAVTEDCAELCRLEAIARHGLIEMRGGRLALQEFPPVENWATLIADPAHLVLVGTLDDAVVAMLVMRFSKETQRGIISHVYVEVEGRGLGLGDGMIEVAVAEVSASGLAGIEGFALPGDRETKNLFERAGITARKLVVYRALR